MHEKGIENFTFEVLEYCDASKLDELEDYYIQKYNSINNGYNIIRGGQHNIGESNSHARLSEQDVYDIREAYANHKTQKEIYEKYKNVISFNYFQFLWQGHVWKNIHMDVYTKENRLYYTSRATLGEKSPVSLFTNKEVLDIRKRYVNETAKDIYQDYKDRCPYQTFQQILWGRTYKDVPIYDKKNNKWIN